MTADTAGQTPQSPGASGLFLPDAVVRARLDWAIQTLQAEGFEVTAPLEVRENTGSLTALFRTTDGDVFLKSVRGASLHEPEVTRAVHRLAPGLVPAIRAENRDLGCWLVDSGGTGLALPELLRQSHIPPLLAAQAALQRLTLNTGADWLARGAKDLAPTRWPGYLSDLRGARGALEIDDTPQEVIDALAGADTALSRLTERLVAMRPPMTVVHMDLRRNSITSRDGRPHLINWGDAGFGPAFLDPVPLFSELAALGLTSRAYEDLADAVLRPWTDMAPMKDLRAARDLCRIVYPLLYAHRLIHARPNDETLAPAFNGLLRFYLSTFLQRLGAADL